MQRRLIAGMQIVGVVVLASIAVLGWWNLLGTEMVSRSNIREACYLAVAFDDHFEQYGTTPSAEDAQSFPSRLRFLRIEEDRYLFACGRYGRDLLVIRHRGSGNFEFFVEASSNPGFVGQTGRTQ